MKYWIIYQIKSNHDKKCTKQASEGDTGEKSENVLDRLLEASVGQSAEHKHIRLVLEATYQGRWQDRQTGRPSKDQFRRQERISSRLESLFKAIPEVPD